MFATRVCFAALLVLALEGTRALRSPGRLVLLRHGESLWNARGRFTGWEDVPLTPKGEQEARDAADLLVAEAPETFANIDIVYTSVLCRAIRTAEVCVDAFRQNGRSAPPIRTTWRLNERHYGMLQGLDKRETLAKWDDQKALKEWRLSFGGRPPPMKPEHPFYSRSPERIAALRAANAYGEPLRDEDVPLTESIQDTVERVRPFWSNELQPNLLDGKTCLIVGHANGLRALASCIQTNIDDESLSSLGLPNALPLVYEFHQDGTVKYPVEDCCYIPPLQANYLGDACLVFNALDKDQSGALNREELLDVCRASFDSLDDDGDGQVSAEELAAACGDELLRQADTNGDGLVNFLEYMAWWNKQKQGPGSDGLKSFDR